MKKKLKLSLLQKSALAIGTILIGSGITIGSMIAYANNSDEVLGIHSSVKPEELKNDFSAIFTVEGKLKPIIKIVDPLKKQTVAQMSDDASEYWFVNEPENKMSFDDFFKAYYDRYSESFIQEITYGSFSFYNEYVLAVKPEHFLEFTKWFISNVAWGPDLLTLSSFRIVPGVERNGNAITLGSHSTLHKESSEIKFFPDAFFGSMPIFSSIRGEGNAPDSLTYKLFQQNVSKDKADYFLNNIDQISILKNLSSFDHAKVPGEKKYHYGQLRPFKNIAFPIKLQGKKVKAIIDPKYKPEIEKYTIDSMALHEKLLMTQTHITPGTDQVINNTSLAKNLIFPENIKEEEFKKLIKSFGNSFKDYKYSDLQTFTISDVTTLGEQNKKATNLLLMLKGENNSYRINLYDSTSNAGQRYSELFLEKLVKESILNFLDFYDINEYLNRDIYLYSEDKIQTFYQNKIEAQDSIKNFDSKNLIKYTIDKFQVKDKTLFVTAKKDINLDDKITFTFDIKDLNENIAKKVEFGKRFRSFKHALGYLGAGVPTTLSATPESLTAKDEKGNKLTGLDTRKYQIFIDAYDGLIETVTDKYPYLIKKQIGPHIEKTIDENGVYQYKIADGEYYGLTPDDRIGLPLLLSSSIENYEGISTDFLKYVGAHEYGHHYTLEKSQALDSPNNAVLVGGLNVRAGATDSSFYSYTALVNYLKARTGLEVRRTDALGNLTDVGTFTQFGYNKNDGSGVEWESYEDIWGSHSKNVLNTVKNERRRFIQTDEGLKEAAKLRKVDVGDLYIANSFDYASGTLNPFINGTGKVIFKNNENKEFKTVTLNELLEQLKDGMGNPIKLDPKSSTPKVSVFETAQNENGQIVITKINIFNKDGSPVINVELNTPLTAQELAYVNKKAENISNSILSLYKFSFTESGWNNQSSSVDGKRKFNWKTLNNATLPFVDLYESLIYREDENEFMLGASNLNGVPFNEYFSRNPNALRKSNYYYVVSNDLKNFNNLLFFNSTQFGSLGSVQNPSYFGIRSETRYYGKTLAFTTENKITSSYVIPFTKSRRGFKADAWQSQFNDQVSSFFNSESSKPVEAKFQNSPVVPLRNGFGFTFNPFKNSKINDSGVYFFVIDENNKVVEIPDFFKNLESPKEFPNYKVGYNLFSTSYLTLNQTKLNQAFSDNVAVEVKFNNSSKISPVFDNLEKMIEFGSIDYSKATKILNGTNVFYNWDLDYVKTKFSLEKFKEVLLKEEKDNKELANIIASEQNLANEIIKRFLKSDLFLMVKDFNVVYDLEKNSAIFSKDYGVDLANNSFYDNYVEDISLKTSEEKFTIEDIIVNIKEIIEKIVTFKNGSEDDKNKAFKNLRFNDLQLLFGKIFVFNGSNIETYSQVYTGEFTNGEPTSDALSYFLTRTEPLLNDKFTDYIFNISETLTRDFVQTTYIPETKNLGNLPSYLNNVNEANTGLDYIVDATKLGIWLNKINNLKSINDSTLYLSFMTKDSDKYYQKRSEISGEYFEKLEKIDNEVSEFKAKKLEDLNLTQEEYAKKLADLNSKKIELINERQNKLIDLLKEFNLDLKQTSFATNTLNSSYLGVFNTKSNGYFKDRWQKEHIGMNLYDPITGEARIDEKIRLLDFNGEKITNHPRAYFVSQLYNYGVGSRTISGIYRNEKLDAVAMYGFVPKEYANKIKELKFIDLKTKEEKFLPVNINKTNNIFYLKNQLDPNSKITLEQEGFVSWISDYALMAKYRNTLLKPTHEYTIEFVDENRKTINDKHGHTLFTLGDKPQLAENGKDPQQSPIKINASKTNEDKPVILIDYQFNVTG